jgi:2,5-diketo-D-gluconate reductase A
MRVAFFSHGIRLKENHRMTSVPTITLNDGVEIPQLGFGVFQVPPEDTKKATLEALEVGYRHIDTAEMYGNEKGVGEAIVESGIPRDEIFVTSKLNNSFHAREDALPAFDATMEALGFETLDLFLIHWPMPAVGDFVDTWRAMEEMKATGRVRSIGVSNFQPAHLQRLFDETSTIPSVNQIEVHPYLTNDDVRAFNREHGIATEAWSPIAQGDVLTDPVITEIAARLDRSSAQVTLRWHIQRGDIVFPKSVTRSRIEENLALFDFELSEADIESITALNRNARRGPDPDEFNWIP